MKEYIISFTVNYFDGKTLVGSIDASEDDLKSAKETAFDNLMDHLHEDLGDDYAENISYISITVREANLNE